MRPQLSMDFSFINLRSSFILHSPKILPHLFNGMLKFQFEYGTAYFFYSIEEICSNIHMRRTTIHMIKLFIIQTIRNHMKIVLLDICKNWRKIIVILIKDGFIVIWQKIILCSMIKDRCVCEKLCIWLLKKKKNARKVARMSILDIARWFFSTNNRIRMFQFYHWIKEMNIHYRYLTIIWSSLSYHFYLRSEVYFASGLDDICFKFHLVLRKKWRIFEIWKIWSLRRPFEFMRHIQ